MKFRHILIIAISAVSILTLIAYQGLKSSKSKDGNKNYSTQDDVSTNPASIYSSSTSSNLSSLSSSPDSSSSGGEQVNQKGERRPVQYVHICDTADGIEYVSQGTPKCLGNDTFLSDYSTSVAGTVYSSPCQTTSGTLRYVYISTDEKCPSGTKLLFYNNL